MHCGDPAAGTGHLISAQSPRTQPSSRRRIQAPSQPAEVADLYAKEARHRAVQVSTFTLTVNYMLQTTRLLLTSVSQDGLAQHDTAVARRAYLRRASMD